MIAWLRITIYTLNIVVLNLLVKKEKWSRSAMDFTITSRNDEDAH